jgi:predicted XRE-type DNA-binding protein
MNEILNSFVTDDQVQKISLEIINLAISSTFVIWRKKKSRVMINLRRINIRLYSNVYSLFKRNTILFFFDDSIVFSSIDFIKEFFQQSIDSKDYWKTTFVSQHRELEWLTISSINLDNISRFFQHKIKRVLKKYLWKFILVYIDDIIIFFSTFENHLKHLNEILVLLKKSNAILFFFKSHFDYSNIKTLKHHVNRLKINIMKKKIEVIKNLKFFVTLKNLKKELDFFEYFRNFVSWYSFIEKSLIKLKTQIFKKILRKDRQRFEWTLKIYLEQSDLNLMKSEYQKNSRKIKSFKICINAWKELKKQLCNAIIKIFWNFSRFFILYVDESKKRSFKIVLHQIEKNDVKRFILFLFKSLIEVESRYWATKLKTTTFVWALTKLSQYFDDDFFIVIIDHFALKSTLQTRIIERRSQRLNEWVMFFSTFLSKMTIIHRLDKNHLNADELSRLTFVEDDKEEQKNTQKIDENDFILTLLISTKIAHSNFLNVVRDEIFKNDVFERIFQKIINQMKNSKNFIEIVNFKYQSYRLNSESKLLYLTKWTDSDRLCISAKLSKDILFHVHDANAHDEIHRTYDFLRKSIFMTDMKKRVTKYVTTCSFCQISKNFNQKSYEELQFISIFQKSLFEMSLNFVVKLLMIIKKNNALLTIIDRFSKYVKLISKTKSSSAAIWVERYWEFVYKFWKVFHRIMFDRNSKFTSEFWRKLFNKCDVKLNFITTYHSSANDQAKKFNQIVKIAFRCLLMKQYEKFWNNLLANVELFLNTSANAFSEISLFEVLYDVKSKISLLKLITAKLNVDVKNFLKQRNRIRQDIMNFLRLTQPRMTMIFDVKHKSFRLERKIFLKMTKSEKSEYHVLNQSSLSSKKLKSFKIVRKMSSLIYELELSNFMKNHSIISVIHLKQVKKNSFERTVFTMSSSLIENDEEVFVVEKILTKRTLNDTKKFLIKWKEWNELTWKSKNTMTKNVSKMIKKFRQKRKTSRF